MTNTKYIGVTANQLAKIASDLKAENAKLRELVAELLPFAGDACPDECRYREECHASPNLGTDGLPLMCVAYGHLCGKARELGVTVGTDADN